MCNCCSWERLLFGAWGDGSTQIIFKKKRSTGLVILSVAPSWIFNPRLQHILSLLTLLVPQHQWQPSRQHRLVATNHFQLTCWWVLSKWFNKGKKSFLIQGSISDGKNPCGMINTVVSLFSKLIWSLVWWKTSECTSGKIKNKTALVFPFKRLGLKYILYFVKI